MKSNKNLVLLGMMGSGKSTIGYLLSKNLNIKFNDVDKIDFPSPVNKIEKVIPNENFKIVK